MIQRCEKEDYNVHDARNISVMDHRRHVALHQLFYNLTTPKDQLDYLRELFNDILSQEAKEIFEELTWLSDKLFYAKGLVK